MVSTSGFTLILSKSAAAGWVDASRALAGRAPAVGYTARLSPQAGPEPKDRREAAATSSAPAVGAESLAEVLARSGARSAKVTHENLQRQTGRGEARVVCARRHRQGAR